jgi:TRAP-type transport system periplasmic protein
MGKWMNKALTGLSLGAILSAGAAFAEPRELSIATYIPAASGFVKNMLEPWAAWINEHSGDEFKVKVYAGGTLGKDPDQQDKIVKDGIADMSIIVPGRNPAEYAQFQVFELPAFARSGADGSEAAWQMYKEGTLPGLKDLDLLTIFMSDPYMVHASEPINNLDDLKGKKFRAIGAIQTETLLALGAIPENVKITETPESISRGLLSGALADWSVAKTFKITEVTNHTYNVPLGNLVFVIAMNRDSYAALSDSGKDVFKQASEHWNTILRGYLADQQDSVRKAKMDKGEVVVEATDADIEALREATKSIREEVAGRVGQDLIDAYTKKLAEVVASH